MEKGVEPLSLTEMVVEGYVGWEELRAWPCALERHYLLGGEEVCQYFAGDLLLAEMPVRCSQWAWHDEGHSWAEDLWLILMWVWHLV